MKTLKASEARNNFSELVSQAQFGGEPVVILRRGKKAAVLISYEDFTAYQQGAGVLRDADDIMYRTERLAREIDKAAPGWDSTRAIREMRESR